MAITITDDCINCDACISECPNNAIYEPDEEWAYKDGTALVGSSTSPEGKPIYADAKHDALSDEFYYIVFDKCTECVGFHDEPQCAAVCPVDCCIPDEQHVEDETILKTRQEWMHGDLS